MDKEFTAIGRRGLVDPERYRAIVVALTAYSGDSRMRSTLEVALHKHPRALEISPTAALATAKAIADILLLKPARCVQVIATVPSLLYRSPDTIRNNVDGYRLLFDLTQPQLATLVARQPIFIACPVAGARERIDAFRRDLSLSHADAVAIFRACPQFVSLDVRTLISKVAFLADALAVDRVQVTALVVKRPAILTRSIDALSSVITGLVGRLGYDTHDAAKMICKAPALLTSSFATIERNFDRLVEHLRVARSDMLNAFRKMPQLFYQKPETIIARLAAMAQSLDLAPDAVVRLFLAMPSLAARDPKQVALRVRIAQRIARALGIAITPSDILATQPSVPTYAKKRLLLRLLVARLGLHTGKWSSLIAIDDHAIRVRLGLHLAKLPGTAPEAVRLRRLLDRRLPGEL